jgi:hypothetical protein
MFRQLHVPRLQQLHPCFLSQHANTLIRALVHTFRFSMVPHRLMHVPIGCAYSLPYFLHTPIQAII